VNQRFFIIGIAVNNSPLPRERRKRRGQPFTDHFDAGAAGQEPLNLSFRHIPTADDDAEAPGNIEKKGIIFHRRSFPISSESGSFRDIHFLFSI
jgi:hypothetical protein